MNIKTLNFLIFFSLLFLFTQAGSARAATAFIVSGAGSAVVNGTYTANGVDDYGSTKYINGNGISLIKAAISGSQYQWWFQDLREPPYPRYTRYYVKNAPYGVTPEDCCWDSVGVSGDWPMPTVKSISSPTITTSAATSISSATATLNGNITAVGGENPTVIMYWGTTDGGQNPSNWTKSLSLGVKGVGAILGGDITGLYPGIKYYFTAMATNSAGASWPVASGSFTTLALAPPTVTLLPVTGLTSTTAKFQASVPHTAEGSFKEFTMFWGTTDGGQISSNWGNRSYGSMGNQNLSDPFAQQVDVSGLIPGTKYYFTAMATNSAGNGWPAASGSFTTLQASSPSPITSIIVINPTNLTSTTATLKGKFVSGTAGLYGPSVIFSWGKNNVGQYGIWEHSVAATTTPGSDSFSANITNLSPNTTYYFIAKASGFGIGNGFTSSMWSGFSGFTTPTTAVSLPIVTLRSVIKITSTTANLDGEATVPGATTSGNLTLTIYWGTTDGGQNPANWANNLNRGGTITGLTPKTKYYISAKATNSVGTAWAANSLSFTTLASTTSTITLGAATSVTATATTLNGNLSAGAGLDTVVLIYFGKNSPITSESGNWEYNTTATTSPGETRFSANLSYLVPGTKYYFIARSYSSKGSDIWSNDIWSEVGSFTTLATDIFSCGTSTIQDGDGKSYNTVKIGTQCWMQQNINIGTKIPGSIAQNSNCSSIKKYCYNNDETKCTTYGGLYQWNQAMCGSTTAGATGICPTGWHIPTHDEFTLLERTTCTSGTCTTDFPYDTATTGYRGTNEGDALRSASGLFKWLLTGALNNIKKFYNLGIGSSFWSSSQNNDSAWARAYHSSYSTINRAFGDKTYGFAVRCLMDSTNTISPDIAPTITISSVTNIATTTAILNGNITATGGDNLTVTVYWGTTDGGQTPENWANSEAPTSPTQPQGATDFSKYITGLTPETQYYFTAKATNSAGTSWPLASSSFRSALTALYQDIKIDVVEVTATTATLSGLSSSGISIGDQTYIYWGTTNGGASINWQHYTTTTPPPGQRGCGAVLTGLTPNTKYYFVARRSYFSGGNIYSSGGSFTTLVSTIPAIGTYVLTITPSSGTTTGRSFSASYPAGTVVKFTAIPTKGHKFDHWSGGATGNANLTSIIMDSDKSVTANFVPAPTLPIIDLSDAAAALVFKISGFLRKLFTFRF